MCGLPRIGDEDVEKIMFSILAMKGCDKKKHTEAFRDGELKALIGNIKVQGTSMNWRKAVPQGTRWNEAPKG